MQSHNLPAHQHIYNVYKGKVGDNNHMVMMPASWGHGYQDNDAVLESNIRPSTMGIYNAKAVTGPNTASDSIADTAMGATEANVPNVYISTIPPTIALHYIKRITNAEDL